MSTEPPVLARARVSVTLEFDLGGGPWGADATMGKVFEQASRDARLQVLGMIERGIMRGRIVGEPRVTAIIVLQGEPT